jgi:hypothetical protein
MEALAKGGYIGWLRRGGAGQVSDNVNVNKWMNVCRHLHSASLSVVLFSIVHHELIPMCISSSSRHQCERKSRVPAPKSGANP